MGRHPGEPQISKSETEVRTVREQRQDAKRKSGDQALGRRGQWYPCGSLKRRVTCCVDMPRNQCGLRIQRGFARWPRARYGPGKCWGGKGRKCPREQAEHCRFRYALPHRSGHMPDALLSLRGRWHPQAARAGHLASRRGRYKSPGYPTRAVSRASEFCCEERGPQQRVPAGPEHEHDK